MLVCRGLNGLRYVFVVVNLVALSPGVRKQSKPPPISNAKCRGQRNTSKRSQNEISPWEHVLQWGRRSVVKWYHMFGSWVCLSHVPTCKFNNILHKLIQSATAPPFQNHQKPREEAKQATTRAKKHVRPCWNPFTRSEFICLLIVTVGIPRGNCKTHTYKHTNITLNIAEQTLVSVWDVEYVAFCWIMFTTSILGSLRLRWVPPIGHALILSHQGTAADVVLLVFLQHGGVTGDLPVAPSTQHTWTLGWNDYPLLLLQSFPRGVVGVVALVYPV